MTILVTGGAGYIGAHLTRALRRAGHLVVVVDDLSTGSADRLDGVPIEVADITTPEGTEAMARAMRDHRVRAVIHLAARKRVDESIQRPAWYFAQNLGGVNSVIDAMVQTGVRDLVFSSTAAVYGDPPSGEASEDSPTTPQNVYGQSKLAGEWVLAARARVEGLRATALRYFNVAGTASADLVDRLGHNLIPITISRLLAGESPVIHGDDYPTPDGTCVRDYIHVEDLVDAHVIAVERALSDDFQPPFSVFNVGTGDGYSVVDVLDAVALVSGRTLTPVVGPRRDGDAARAVAAVDRIRAELGWAATRGLKEIVASEWGARYVAGTV